MTHRPILPALGLGFLLAMSAWGQHNHMGAHDYDDGPGGGDPNTPPGCSGVQARITITRNGLSFSPSTVTVDPGQPVCWTWSETFSTHTVKGDDGSFTSGPPTDSGTFQRTFTTPGTYGYHCQVHGNTTSGMRGTIVVRGSNNGGGGGGKGTLAASPGTYTVDEGVGAVTVTIERTGGSDGAASVKYATGNGSAKVNKDFTRRTGTLRWAAGDQAPKTIQVPIKNDNSKEKDETFTIKLSKATGAGLGAGTATVTIRDNDGGSSSSSVAAPTGLQARGLSENEIRLSWAGEAGEVRIERRLPGGSFREIAAVEGANSFTDSGLAGGTTFHYRVRAVGIDGASAISEIAAGATDGIAAACDDSNALCLGNGRFEAMVEWHPAAGSADGENRRMMLPENPNAGLFSTSRSPDQQLLVNLLDGCNINGHHWLYFASLADVELTVKVRETQTGRTWVWFNPAGRVSAPVRDAEAFACN